MKGSLEGHFLGRFERVTHAPGRAPAVRTWPGYVALAASLLRLPKELGTLLSTCRYMEMESRQREAYIDVVFHLLFGTQEFYRNQFNFTEKTYQQEKKSRVPKEGLNLFFSLLIVK